MFGGKEFNDELGLDWYDISARNYDPALGRWFVVDALADAPEQIDKSPYQYAWNNPVYYADPDGNCPICLVFVVATYLLSSEPAMAPTHNQQTNYEGYKNAKDGQTTMLMLGAGGAAAGSTGGLVTEVGMEATGVINPKDVADVVKTGVKKMDDLIQAADDAKQGVKEAFSKKKPGTNGNTLNDTPAEQYKLEDVDTGKTKKFGETTRGEVKFGVGKQKRYTKKELKDMNVKYVQQAKGTKLNMHRLQTKKIRKFKKNNNGNRPDLNKTDY